ncbi:MAG TPA: AAA family ATPase [Ktedonobacterales bacterium]|jgi:predicted ATPase/DNA-binding SARP family transcriptional activator|nr:AAA family ATPase [Ktedonobacterales bacterium]
MAELVIWSLGTPSIEYQGSAIKVDTRKATALLIYLAIEAQPRSRDTIAALLWPEHDQTRARAALRRTLSVLNKALGGNYLSIERDRLSLAGPTPLWVDALEFHRLLAQRRTHDHPEKEVCASCLEPLQKAVTLYRDDFLAGFTLRDSMNFEEWQLAQRQSLRDELGTALGALTRTYILVGDLSEAITTARRWLALDPLNEQASRFLMRLYDWTGQRAAALRQYEVCAQTLERELGTAPLAVTTRLYEAIRAHRAAGPPEAVAERRGAEKPDQSAAIVHVTKPPRSLSPASQAPRLAVAPLVGRDVEWKLALRVYEESAHGGHALIVEGEAGIGKTRLADELIAHARRQGSVVGVARCYQGESSLAYTPLAALLRSVVGVDAPTRLHDLPDIWLSEACRLAPELAASRSSIATPAPLDTPGAQSRFFEGLRETLLAACAAGTPPGLLVMDDMQWVDEATLDALKYLTRRLEQRSVCIVVTWRSDAVDTRHRLRDWLAETQRQGRATHIALGRLAEDDVRSWVRHDLGDARTRHEPDLAARLYQETEGLPFFIAQYVMALASGADPLAAEKWTAPVGVYDLLRSRLSALSETGWQALTSAAILGRSFDLDTLREVSGRSEEENAGALDELLTLGLIREAPDSHQGEVSYDFTHDKLRAFAYDETTLARRRLLHRRAAEALVAASHRQWQGAERAAQIAQHYAAAGDYANAATQHTVAGGRARELYAHADAIRHFQRALELGYPHVAELHEAIGDAYTSQGDYAQALASYAEAAAHAQGDILARVLHRIGVVLGRRGEWEAAQQRFADAIEAVGQVAITDASTMGEQARIYADWSLTARHLDEPEQARTYAERALRLATAASDLQALAQAHNILGALANSQGDSALALSHLEESLKLAERLDDVSTRAAALNNLALALHASGQIERALPMAEAALALTVAQGDRHHEAALHNNVADLLHAIGHTDDAMAHLKQAVGIYAEIGVEAGAVQPGIWKMVDW